MMIKKITFIIGCVFCLVVWNFISVSWADNKTPTAVNGLLDLSVWNFDASGAVPLAGTWEYYDNQLIAPQDFSIKQPSPGTKEVLLESETPLDTQGTFRLRVTSQSPRLLSLILRYNESSKYAIWIDNDLIFKQGDLLNPQSGSEHRNFRVKKAIPFSIKSGETVITIWAGNDISPLVIDSHVNAKAYYERQDYIEVGIISILFIMALYHFGLYYFRRKDRSPLYFGLFSLVILILHSVSNFENGLSDQGINRFLFWLYQQFGRTFWVNLWNYSVIGCLFTFYLFLKCIFPSVITKRLHRSYLIFLIAITANNFLSDWLPSVIVGILSILFNVNVLILGIFCVYIVIKALKRRMENALLVLVGTCIIFSATLIDVFISQGILSMPKVVGYGVIVFVFIQAIVIARRFSKAFDNVESLSESINARNRKNEELLNTLRASTQKLAMISSNINDVVEETVNGVNDMAGTINSIASNVSNTTIAMGDVNQEVHHVSDSIASIYERVQVAKDLSDANKTLVEDSRQSVQNMTQAMSGIRSATLEANDSVTEISSKIEFIKGILASINYIANQTKLLSFNASIEAAKAKEHGKGFSVVATEVGKLASEVKKMAGNIQLSMNDMLKSIADSSQKSVECIEKVDLGDQSKLIMENTIGRVSENIDQSNEKVMEVFHFTKIQQQSTEVLNEKAESIYTQTQQINSDIANAAAVIQEITAAMQELGGEINLLDGLIQALNDTSKEPTTK